MRRGHCVAMAAAAALAACQGAADTAYVWAVELSARVADAGSATLSAPGTAQRVLRFDGKLNTDVVLRSNLACGTVEGLPAGMTASLGGCPALGANIGSGAAVQVPITVTLNATAAVTGGVYNLTLPATLCAAVLPEAGVRPEDLCARAVVAFSVTVTPAGVAPPPGVPAWQDVGGPLNVQPAPSLTDGPALVADAQGQPLAAWVENEAPVVRRWDGSAWQTLAGGLHAGSASGPPALALDALGAPVVAWAEARPGGGATDNPRQVQARRWDGTAWQRLGAGPVDDPASLSAHDPALALVDGRLVLAWSERHPAGDAGSRVQVRVWDGSAWAQAGSSAVTALGEPSATQLAATDDGRLAVAWLNLLDGRVRVAAALPGQAWAEVGNFAAVNVERFAMASSSSQGLMLAIPPSPPATQFSVQSHRGGVWSPLGTPQGSIANGARVLAVALAAEPGSGQPLLAWSQSTTSQRLFEVRRWQGPDWVALGTALPALGRTATGQNRGVALAAGLRPFVATEVSAGVPNADYGIRVREFR